MRPSIMVSLMFSAVDQKRPFTGPEFCLSLRYWYSTLERLTETGVDVTVLTPATVQPGAALPFRILRSRMYWLRFNHTPLRHHPIPIATPRVTWHVARDRRSAAVLSPQFGMATIWSLIGCRLSGKALWIYQESTMPESRLKRRWKRFLLRFADHVIVNSAAAERQVIAEYNVSPGCVTRIPVISAPRRADLQQESVALPACPIHPLFVTVAQLIPRKNLDRLIQAAAQVHEDGWDFSLWIAGVGPEEDRLRERICTFGIERRVTLLGHIPYNAIGHVYDAADVYVFPTLFDYRSVSILEAMRFGLPVITSAKDGNVGELTVHEHNALVFDPDRVDMLAGHISRLVRNPVLGESMGLRSADMIKDETSDRAARMIAELLCQRIGA